MIKIRIVKGDAKVEKFYTAFAEIVSKKNSIVLIENLLLEELFHLAKFEEVDFNQSIIRCSESENEGLAKIYLKSGMKLDLERVRINDEIYALTSMKFSWKEYNYEYNIPEKINDIEDVYLVIS